MEIHSGRVKSKLIIGLITVLFFLLVVSTAYSQGNQGKDGVMVSQLKDSSSCQYYELNFPCLIFGFVNEDLNNRLFNTLSDLIDSYKIPSGLKLISNERNFIGYSQLLTPYPQFQKEVVQPVFGNILKENDFIKILRNNGFSDDEIKIIMKNFKGIKRILEEIIKSNSEDKHGKIEGPLYLKKGKISEGKIKLPYFNTIKDGNKLKIRKIIKIGDFFDDGNKDDLLVNYYNLDFINDIATLSTPKELKTEYKDKEGLLGIKISENIDKNKYLMIAGPNATNELDNSLFFKLNYTGKFPLNATLGKNSEIVIYIFEPPKNNWEEYIQGRYVKTKNYPLIYTGKEKDVTIYCGNRGASSDEFEIDQKINENFPADSYYINSLESCNLEVINGCQIKGEFKFYTFIDEAPHYAVLRNNNVYDLCNQEIIAKNGQRVVLRGLSNKEIMEIVKNKDKKAKTVSFESGGKTYINANPEENSEVSIAKENIKRKTVGSNTQVVEGKRVTVQNPAKEDVSSPMLRGEKINIRVFKYKHVDKSYLEGKGFNIESSTGDIINEEKYPQVKDNYIYLIVKSAGPYRSIKTQYAAAEAGEHLSGILNKNIILKYGPQIIKREVYGVEKRNIRGYYIVALVKVNLKSISGVTDAEIRSLREKYSTKIAGL